MSTLTPARLDRAERARRPGSARSGRPRQVAGSLQLVTLRSQLPVQLVTLQHQTPTWSSQTARDLRVQGPGELPIELPHAADDENTTTPKVSLDERETTAGKGGRAR